MPMMRINLLPVRQVQKRVAGRQILVVYAFVLFAASAANFVWQTRRDDDRKKREAKVADIQRRITELEKIIGEVNNIKKRREEVKNKLELLEGLRKGRAGPVRVMDALALAIPRKVSISTFTENNLAVTMHGEALSHEDVAEFMRGLAGLVWTPKGMGRVVEKKKDGSSLRVELIAQDGTIEDFVPGDVKNFFTDIDLKSAEQKDSTAGRTVSFDMSMKTSYSI